MEIDGSGRARIPVAEKVKIGSAAADDPRLNFGEQLCVGTRYPERSPVARCVERFVQLFRLLLRREPGRDRMNVRAGELRIGQFPAVRIEFQRAFTGQHDAAVLRKLAQLRGRLRERVRRVGDRDDLEGAGAALDEFLFGDDRDRQLAAQEGVVPVEAVLLVRELLVSAHGHAGCRQTDGSE